MEIPQKRALLASIRQRPEVVIPSQTYEHDEKIPWMSWSVHLRWTHRDDYVHDFLARQPELRRALLAEHDYLPVYPPTGLAPHDQRPDRVHWEPEGVDIYHERWANVVEIYKQSPLSAAPIEQLWVICGVYGRYDEDTTTSAHHMVLLNADHMVYVYFYQETLH